MVVKTNDNLNFSYYKSEIEGMIAFWNEIGLEPDYELNTDGRYSGNLIEFKLVFQDTHKHKEQLARSVRAYNSCALPIPKYGYLISLNEHIYIKIDNEIGQEIQSGTWNKPSDFLTEFLSQNEFIKGWVDEYSIVAYNNKLCKEYPKNIKTKEDVKNEFINPKFLNIQSFDWEKQIAIENADNLNIGWLHFNMNMLGPYLLKKQLGAFFTPEQYVKVATSMVREAISRVPIGNDYIIFDRCAGTGNLERFLRADELSHCVLNTYDYTEWTTLKGLYDGRVKMIIPPTRKNIDFNNGLLTDGDALSKDFFDFCFHSGLEIYANDEFNRQSELLYQWFKDDKMTIIMLENPPFVEPQGGASQGKPTFTIKEKFLYKEMANETFDTKNVNRATENLFIWSAFKYFLRQPTDTYILFSPIKYWKSQHIIDKTFIRGYICNREYFNASEGGIALIEWLNRNDSNECLNVDSDLGARKIYKIRKNPAELLINSKAKTAIAWLFNLSNIPKPDNGKVVNDIEAYASYCKVQKPYKLAEDNILIQLPLWLANCYEYADYTEREVIMKTADGGTDYYNDTEFLYKCFLWAGISQRNKSLSRIGLINEFCFGQDTRSDSILKGYTLDTADKNLYDTWIEVLNLAKNTEEYNCAWNYGLSQICTDINIKVGSGTFNKTGKEIEIPKYRILDEKVNELKRLLKKYYQSEIKHKLFKYKLLK